MAYAWTVINLENELLKMGSVHMKWIVPVRHKFHMNLNHNMVVVFIHKRQNSDIRTSIDYVNINIPWLDSLILLMGHISHQNVFYIDPVWDDIQR